MYIFQFPCGSVSPCARVPFLAVLFTLLALFVGGCAKQRGPEVAESSFAEFSGISANLRPLKKFTIQVPEPSGLCLSADGKSLWVVSDEDDQIYRLDMEGRVIDHFGSGYEDMEGITALEDGSLAIIAERARKLVLLDPEGRRLAELPIDIPGVDNSGPEALAFDSSRNVFHIIQESPGYFLTLDKEGNEVARSEFKFALDYSSIFFEPIRGHLWVLSDRSKSIHVLDQNLQMLTTFSIDLRQMEGIAVDYVNQRLYVVSDPLNRLYVLEFDLY